MSADSLWIPSGCGALALLCAFLSLRAIRRRRLVDDTPTSKSTGVFIGMVELAGEAFSEQPLISHLAESECVHFAWTIEEHWEKTVRETYTDSQGKTQSRTRTDSGWITVASGQETIPFFLKDDHGEILVQPEGAELQTTLIFSETCTPFDNLYFAKGPGEAIDHSTQNRRFTENAIPHRAPVYVIGNARERKDAVAAEIAADEQAPIFVISVHGEKGVRSQLGWRLGGWFLGGAVLAYITHRTLPGFPDNPLWPVHWVGPLLFTLLWTLGWGVTAYNSITGLRRRVEQAASNIDVMLKRRSDLFPKLAQTVQATAAHEASLQENLARLRSLAHSSERAERTLLALSENYPALSTNSSFLALQTELSATETRIALARSYHAEITSFFLTRTEILPDRWLCRLLPPLPKTAGLEKNDAGTTDTSTR